MTDLQSGVKYHNCSGAVEFLAGHGFPATKSALDTMVTRGGGPVFVKWGRYRLYPEDELLAWAHGRASARRTSSSTAA